MRAVHRHPVHRFALVLLALSALWHPAPAAAEAATVDPNQVGAGELLWRSERGYVSLPAADVELDLTVTGLMVHGRLTQRFHNPTGEVIEAVFVFPMPDRSAVYRMEMRIGDRRIESVIQEKEEARRTYQRAKESGRKATLVDQYRPNLFTTSLANINPDETVEVTLEFYEEVGYRDGRFHLRFPLTFTPRYDSQPRADRQATDGDSVPPFPQARIGVTLVPGFPLAELRSPSHELSSVSDGTQHHVETKGPTILADRDFLLWWRPEPSSELRQAVFVEERDGERYVLTMVLPPEPGGELGQGIATETVFVVDVSGSMAGPSIDQARTALSAAVERLRPDDRFNIIVFNDDLRLFRPQVSYAVSETVEQAKKWIAGLAAGGGTRIEPALRHAISTVAHSRGSHARRIVFLTDGAVANEDALLRTVAERPQDIRVHTIGIGGAPNAYLMRKMAERGRGHHTFVADSFSAPEAIADFLECLNRPVMEDVRLDGATAGWLETVPATLPDLYAGVPLMISAKLAPRVDSAQMTIGGYTRVGWLETPVTVDVEAPAGAGIAYRWARMRVEAIVDSLHEGADPTDVRNEVVDLALQFNLVTRYTSLVAVEDRPTALGTSRSSRFSAALPAGGTNHPLKRWLGGGFVMVGLLMIVVLRREILR